jgi:hypothetical protein
VAGLGQILTAPGHYLPGPNAVRFFIDERDVKEVVAENPVPPEIIALMQDVLGVDGTDVDGVTVWEVPATGTTPHEAPPTSQVITTAPSG